MGSDYSESNAAKSDSSINDQNKHDMTSITDMKFLQPNGATSIIRDTLSDKARTQQLSGVNSPSSLDGHSSIHTDMEILQPTDFKIPSNKQTLGFFLPISFVVCVSLWLLYAYRHPHSKSGQLLIQVSAIRSNTIISNNIYRNLTISCIIYPYLN